MKYLIVLIAVLCVGCFPIDVDELETPVVLIGEHEYSYLVVVDGNDKTHFLCCYAFAVERNSKTSGAIFQNFDVGDTIILPNGKWNLK